MNKALLSPLNPLFIARRFRGKINIQKPRKPFFHRQILIDVSKPFYGPPKHKLPEFLLCDGGEKKKQEVIDNPFERILANECLNWFNTSKMVVFLHLNSISMEDKMPIFAALRKHDMHLRTYGKKIVNMATTGTRYEAVNCLFTSHQNIIFGQPENADKMFKILKKAPQLVVMGGIIQDQLMSKNELVDFSKMPNLDVARAQLCSVLLSAGSSIVSQLNQAQQQLVMHLDKHVELQSDANTSTLQNEEKKDELQKDENKDGKDS